jgi:hypothetical protein
MAWTLPLREVTLDYVPIVGGKNASLGEMLRELAPLGVKVPDGFAVTADAYRYFLRAAGLEPERRSWSCADARLAGSEPLLPPELQGGLSPRMRCSEKGP